jgi:hypothetical protein
MQLPCVKVAAQGTTKSFALDAVLPSHKGLRFVLIVETPVWF